jgi:hypothetical protein
MSLAPAEILIIVIILAVLCGLAYVLVRGRRR